MQYSLIAFGIVRAVSTKKMEALFLKKDPIRDMITVMQNLFLQKYPWKE